MASFLENEENNKMIFLKIHKCRLSRNISKYYENRRCVAYLFTFWVALLECTSCAFNPKCDDLACTVLIAIRQCPKDKKKDERLLLRLFLIYYCFSSGKSGIFKPLPKSLIISE